MSARDMGILSKAMITKYPEMLEDTKQRFRNFPDNHPKPIRMENWNWMLPGAAFAYEGTDGLKPEVLIQLDTDLPLLLNVVMYVLFRLLLKQNQWTKRFTESRELIEYGFNNFEKQKLKVDKTIHSLSYRERRSSNCCTGKEITVIAKKGIKILIKLN